ncbi:MAG TPA: hypothetical protein VII72_01445 [Myxococcota bacterium]|jgi:hypothetical protein
MKKCHLIAAFSASILIVAGCTTTAKFIVPPDTELYIYERPEPVAVAADGTVTTRPYFWTAAGGVPYSLRKDGVVVKVGKLRTKFRVVSLFWPPFAEAYWPMGLNSSLTYDLVNETQGIKKR